MFKKFIITAMFLLTFVATPALSATDLLFSTLSVKTDEKKSFDVALSIDPKGVKNYTTKVELKYPSDLLEITDFNFSNGWMQIAQPSYDLIDNAGGVMIKTAGYPGGVSDKKTFGNISFKTKKVGRGTISVGGNSLSLSDNNQNIFSGSFPNIVVSIGKIEKEEEDELQPTFEIPKKIQEGYVFSKDLKAGDKNVDVAYLQICLKSDGVYAGDITGIFDTFTENATIKFQEKYNSDILFLQGLSEGTGIADEITRYKLNEVCFMPPKMEKESGEDYEKIPEQLFDINLEIDYTEISNLKNLIVRVIFTSFGTMPTPVDLTFRIFDENRNEVYKEKDKAVVETEKILTKRFPNLDLALGKYTLELTTLYNTDVVDEFTQDFEIVGKKQKNVFHSIWFQFFIFIIIVLVVFIVLKKRKNGEDDGENQGLFC